MYLPASFEEDRIEVLHALMESHPLGALVTVEADGLNANHLPFEIAPATEHAPYGILRAHVARANPLWREARSLEALVLFQGAQTYVTPSWYAEKKETGKVVPTYNYAVVHAYGPLRVVEDAQWLRAMLTRLTARHEAPRAMPWQLDDAPDDYIEKMLTAVVGIEIVLTRLVGKWKTSQNRSAADRLNIVAGLQEAGDANAFAMAGLVGGT